MLRALKYVENVYYHELAKDIRRFGYSICNHPRGDFEIQGVPAELCQRFSKRHKQIDEALAELLRAKPELDGSNLKAIRERLATAERARKIRRSEERRGGDVQVDWESTHTRDARSGR